MLNAGWKDYPQTSLSLSLAQMEGLLGRHAEALDAYSSVRAELAQSNQHPLLLMTIAEELSLDLRSRRIRLDEFNSGLQNVTQSLDQLGLHYLTIKVRDLEANILSEYLPPPAPGGLTERELEVLRLAVAGNSDREIADHLFISPRTVNAHMRNMFSKSGSTNRTDLAVWALKEGIV